MIRVFIDSKKIDARKQKITDFWSNKWRDLIDNKKFKLWENREKKTIKKVLIKSLDLEIHI